MTSPIVTDALIDTIKDAGFNVGFAQLYDLAALWGGLSPEARKTIAAIIEGAGR